MSTILIINYAFPPFGGAASRRVTKLVKYLGRRGHNCVIVTASRTNNPLYDESLLKEPPSTARVVRTPSLEPVTRSGKSRIVSKIRRLVNIPMIPNVTSLWAVCAVLPALRAARAYRPDAIICSAPEFPAFLVGVIIKARTNVPLILDYRDEWSYHPEKMESLKNSRLKSIKQKLEERLEKSTARRADGIIANTASFAEMMTSRLQVPARKIKVITNGYDPDDFPDEAPDAPPSDKTVITHLGTIDHVSLFPPLLIRSLDRAALETDSQVELRLVGNVYPELRKNIERVKVQRIKICFRGFVPAQKAYELLRQSDLNIQVNELLPGKERYHNLKLFDYLYSEKPMLVYGPKESEIARIAARSGLARVVEPGDSGPLFDFFKSFLKGGFSVAPDRDYIRGFAWPELAGKVEDFLKELKEGKSDL